MAEQSEQQSGEPEQAPQATGYRESADHVPDPTAMTGTLETSGTGGGVNERISGMTRIFGDVERAVARVETVVQEHLGEIVDEVRTVLHHEEAAASAAPVVTEADDSGAAKDAEPSADVATEGAADDSGQADKAPAKKAAAKKTDDADK